MGDRRYTFELLSTGAAPTDGQAVAASTALSDTGAALSTVSNGTGHTTVYDTDWSFPAGGKSILLTNQASGTGGGPGQTRVAPDVASSIFATDVTFKWSAAPTATRLFYRARHASGYIFSLARKANDTIDVQNAAGASIQAGTVAIPLTARIEIVGSVATGANSSFTVKIYSVTGTLLDTIPVTNADLGATSYTIAAWEVFNSGTEVIGLNVDSWGVRALASGTPTAMGPITASNPPIISATVTGDLAMLDARASMADNAFTMTIARVSGATATATKIMDGVWVIPLQTTTALWRVTAADTVNGLSSTSDFTIPAKAVAAPVTQRLVKTPTGPR